MGLSAGYRFEQPVILPELQLPCPSGRTDGSAGAQVVNLGRSAVNLSASSRKIVRALVSVHDKTGLEELAGFLSERGVEILSTGGTADAIRAAGIEVRDVSEVTGHPELLCGRVKSLHPVIHGGILARRNIPDDIAELEKSGIGLIDLVVASLYPFTTRDPAMDAAGSIELIDIGGPAMIRAAAKNHAFTTVVTDPYDYLGLFAEMEAGGGQTSPGYRRRMAARAFSLTAAYDAAISSWLRELDGAEVGLPVEVNDTSSRTLPYGENPHQHARFLATGEHPAGFAAARQLGGKPIGYNNLLDADAAVSLAAEFDSRSCACVIVKHGSPCGAALASSPVDAFQRAWNSDPVSAFGGVVALNQALDAETAEQIVSRFVEVVIVPGASEEALAILQAKPRLRVLSCAFSDFGSAATEYRSVCGGILAQDRDRAKLDRSACTSVTERKPTSRNWADLEFAWAVSKHCKSNAIAIAGNSAIAGIGCGQTSRVAAAAMAAGHVRRHHPEASDLVAASDGFLPFGDSLQELAMAGVSFVLQPGGSRNDQEVIETAETLGLGMVFTGLRSFRH